MGTVARMPVTPLLYRNIRRIRPPSVGGLFHFKNQTQDIAC
jgi:hypothetical protein